MIPDLITKQKQNRWVTQNNSLYGNMYFFNNLRIAAKLNDSSISEVSWSIAEIGPSGGTVCPGTSDKESDYIDGDWFILDDIPACGGTKPTETGMVAL
jgi:hypothetical protein